MKRALAILLVVLVSLAIVLALLLAVTFGGRQAITDGFEINGVRVVKDGMVSFGVLQIGDGQVALVDAGMNRAGSAVRAELSRRRLGTDAVRAVLLTHGHPDHIAAVRFFPNAEVMALAPEVAIVEGRAGSRGPAMRFLPARPTGIRVTRVLHDGDIVTLGRMAIRVYPVPGHTSGSTAFLVNGVLFLGDSADATSGGQIKGAPWLVTEDTSQNRASLAHLAGRLRKEGAEVKVLVFSHSGVLTQGLQPLIAFAEQR